MSRTFVLALILLLVPCVHAENGSGAAKPLVAQTLSSFNQESDRIRKQMEPGGIYEHIPLSDKTRVEARLNDMQKLLQANAESSNLQDTDKVTLANAQEEVNGILQHNDNNRLVCEHVAPVGSHRPITTCQTYGQKMAREEQDQKYLQDRGRTPQRKSGK